MNSDLTFITNEENRNLLERFKVLVKDTHIKEHLSESTAQTSGPREVILSEYLVESYEN